jgi:hypothetical protein
MSGKFVLVFACWLLAIMGCGGRAIDIGNVGEQAGRRASKFPFEVREPDVYQGEFTLTHGAAVDRWFRARNGERWRLERLVDGRPRRTHIRNGDLYVIDHEKRVYAIQESQNSPPAYPSLSPHELFAGFVASFEELGSEGAVTRYRLKRRTEAVEEVTLHYDTEKKMIVRQERTDITNGGRLVTSIFEIRDLKLEAHDELFAIPHGYRQISWAEYQKR